MFSVNMVLRYIYTVIEKFNIMTNDTVYTLTGRRIHQFLLLQSVDLSLFSDQIYLSCLTWFLSCPREIWFTTDWQKTWLITSLH